MGVKKRTVIHKRHDCIGCGSCALIAPRQWTMNDADGKACLKGAQRKGNKYMVSQVDEDEIDVNQQAADTCPVNVIQVAHQ